MSTLLLVPAPGDPHGLLAKGRCGSRPPVAYRTSEWRETHEECQDCDAHDHRDAEPHCVECDGYWPCGQPDRVTKPAGWSFARPHSDTVRPDALVLAWRLDPLPEGCDRLARVADQPLHGVWSSAHLDQLLVACETRCLGQLIIVDQEGSDKDHAP